MALWNSSYIVRPHTCEHFATMLRVSRCSRPRTMILRETLTVFELSRSNTRFETVLCPETNTNRAEVGEGLEGVARSSLLKPLISSHSGDSSHDCPPAMNVRFKFALSELRLST